MPTAAALARLYDEGYFASDAAHATGYADYAGMADDARDTFRRRLMLVERHVGSGRILDVGAGFGYLTEVAAARFPERWIVERSASAAARVAAPARVIVGTWEQAKVPERYFDVVSMQDCLEHFPDPLVALEKTRAALRPGGATAVTPNVGSWAARPGTTLVHSIPEHVVLFGGDAAPDARTAGFGSRPWCLRAARGSISSPRGRVGFRARRALARAVRRFGARRRARSVARSGGAPSAVRERPASLPVDVGVGVGVVGVASEHRRCQCRTVADEIVAAATGGGSCRASSS
jgi:SAM-dependent methyltransferase